MTQANDSILVTPGSGATVATHTANSKEHEVVMQADASGHLIGTKPTYHYMIPNQVYVASASNPAWDMFNADGTAIVRVQSILFIPDVVTAVTGVSVSWLLERSTAVGTGGTAQTAWLADSSDSALSANITCRSKPTGGATAGTDLYSWTETSEETATSRLMVAAQGGLELLPPALRPTAAGLPGKGLVLRQNEGVRLTQVTSSSAGNAAHLIGFTVE